MSRSISNTSISFGLVSVPVKVHKAVDDHRVGFHQRHAGECGGAIGYVRTCRECSREVEYADISKGYETDDGKVVTVTSEELAEVRGDTVVGIEVVQFCHADEIPAMILGAPFYLEPHVGKGKAGSTQSYVLLRTVLSESDKTAICKFVLRDVPHLGVLRVEGNVLVLQSVCWAEDIRTPEFAVLDKKIELDPKAVKMAHALVDSLMGTFEHSTHQDTYLAAVRELVTDKAAGTVPTPVGRDDHGTEDVSDLLAALTASVAARGDKATTKRRHPAGKRLAVA